MVRHSRRRSTHRSRGHRGGYSNVNYALSPALYDGQGVGTSGVDLQIIAGQAGGRRRRRTRKMGKRSFRK